MEQLIIAITGPSGIGKSTLSNNLKMRNGFEIPVHTTTRTKRPDDEEGFYRYLSHNDFKRHAIGNEFLFWSGDNEVIDKKYGNYYGILNQDYDILRYKSHLIFFISYKDIEQINSLIKQGYNIKIVNLIYNDLEKNMPQRLNSVNRCHTEDDVKRRIECAIDYEKEFGHVLSNYDILRLYGDKFDSEQIYDEVIKKLVRK